MTAIEQWRGQGQFLLYKHQQIFYRDTGEADLPVLLLIHGFPTASIDWQPLWADLEKRFRLVTLDMVGFGLSDKPKQYDYSIFDQADLFEFLLQRLDIKACHIFAHDYGDTVAQELLSRRLGNTAKSNYQSIIFLNGGLFPETHKPVFLQKLLLSPFGKYIVRLNSYKKFKKTFEHICNGNMPERDLKIYWQLLNIKDGHGVMPQLIHYMTERRKNRERWVGALQKSDIPLKVIDGLEDPISGAHMLARYEELVPNANTTGLAGIGHYPQVEAPQQVLTAAQGFWQQVLVASTKTH